MAGSVRDFALDRALAVRLSEEDAAAGDDDAPPQRSAGPLPTEWRAPALLEGI